MREIRLRILFSMIAARLVNLTSSDGDTVNTINYKILLATLTV